MRTLPARRFWRNERGASIVEFGLILPVFVMLVLGLINVSLLTNAVSSMNYAAQEAARCAAVNSTTCGNPSATIAFAESRYRGPLIHPTFVPTTSACGQRVTAEANFELNVAIYVYQVPIRATSCYPVIA